MNEYTTNQPIGGTNGNNPVQLNPPPQGSKWQTEPEGALTPLGEALKSNCLSDFSGSIYKHIVYNPHTRNIDAVINQAQEDGKDWQFSHAQPVTEYEWVAVFEKWIS